MSCVNYSCWSDEQLKMNDCYYDNKDWRVCKKEVSCSSFPNLPNILVARSSCSHSRHCRWKSSENAGKDGAMIGGLRARMRKRVQMLSATPVHDF